MKSPYKSEREMYEPVREWLTGFLSDRIKNARVRAFDTSSTKLSNLIERQRLHDDMSPDWPTWEIRVDIVGFAHDSSLTHLALVECKNTAMSLDHLAQLLGYARVARPTFAFLISPQGPNNSLIQLLKTHQRLDVLEYAQEDNKLPRAFVVARWDANANAIAYDSIITTDAQKVVLDRFG